VVLELPHDSICRLWKGNLLCSVLSSRSSLDHRKEDKTIVVNLRRDPDVTLEMFTDSLPSAVPIKSLRSQKIQPTESKSASDSIVTIVF
jgi:hypothetical protein